MTVVLLYCIVLVFLGLWCKPDEASSLFRGVIAICVVACAGRYLGVW